MHQPRVHEARINGARATLERGTERANKPAFKPDCTMSEPVKQIAVAKGAACKQVVFEVDDITPRKLSDRFAHSCDLCKLPMHSPMMCEAVNAREFRCLAHLREYNADAAPNETSPCGAAKTRRSSPRTAVASEGDENGARKAQAEMGRQSLLRRTAMAVMVAPTMIYLQTRAGKMRAMDIKAMETGVPQP
eukprot:6209511-Pleurochrysis_carterae.AAC.5